MNTIALVAEKQKNWKLYISVTVLAILILSSIFAPLLQTHNPFEPDIAARLQGPSLQHYFGTDALGRDMYSRILYGGRASMMLAFLAAVLSLFAGTFIGMVSGFYGGKVDHIITIIANIFQGIPGSCFMIAIAGILGPSIKSLILALVIVSWAGFSRVVRAEVIKIKEEPFIEGLICLGCNDFTLLTKHILPNIVNKMVVLFTIRLGRSVLAVAGLSFLGLGVQPPTPDWSMMVNDAILYYRSSPHLILFPGLFIFMLIYSLNILGDALHTAFDATSQEVRRW